MEFAVVPGNRVLLLNWRDITHPLAGGAEQYVWEVARGLAAMGAVVILFTASTPGLARQEVRHGVLVRRQGGTFSVYLWAALFLLRNRRSFDAVADCQNGIPFFAPVFLIGRPAAVVLLIHHVHQDQFATRFHWPLRAIGKFLEGPASRIVYRTRPIIAVSPYTRAEVRRRLRLSGPIFVVPNGVAPDLPGALTDRNEHPTLIYVGRLVSYKRLPLLLAAVAELRRRGIEVVLEVVGSGPARGFLEAEVRRLQLTQAVTFWGKVSDEQRTQLLASGWLLVNPSAGEGWGLTVIEANAVGRPAIAFRVPGLADSIVPGQNGWLVDRADGLGDAIAGALTSLASPAQRKRFEDSCRAWARRFSWTRTVGRVADVVHLASTRRPGVCGLPYLRRASDVATVIHLEISRGVDAVRQLVPSDLWKLDGSTLDVLLQGMDIAAAATYLEGLGLSGRAEARVAGVVDLLFGPGAARNDLPLADDPRSRLDASPDTGIEVDLGGAEPQPALLRSEVPTS